MPSPLLRSFAFVPLKAGWHILTVPVNSFSIVELPITVAFTTTYICNLKRRERSDDITHYDNIAQHTTGEGPFPWVYILFRGDGVANTEQQDSRVVLDLVSPMLYFRGLGGEIFPWNVGKNIIQSFFLRARLKADPSNSQVA